MTGKKWICPGCCAEVGLTTTKRLFKHTKRRNSSLCPGSDYYTGKPMYPQFIKLWGWYEGNRIMAYRKPGWVPPGDKHLRAGRFYTVPGMMKLVLEAYPEAEIHRVDGHFAERSVLFRSDGLWYFMVDNTHVGENFPSQKEALGSLHRYLRGNVT